MPIGAAAARNADRRRRRAMMPPPSHYGSENQNAFPPRRRPNVAVTRPFVKISPGKIQSRPRPSGCADTGAPKAGQALGAPVDFKRLRVLHGGRARRGDDGRICGRDRRHHRRAQPYGGKRSRQRHARRADGRQREPRRQTHPLLHGGGRGRRGRASLPPGTSPPSHRTRRWRRSWTRSTGARARF